MKIKNSDTRAKILATAEQLIYEEGIQSTSLDRLVKISGVARKSIYHHFANKDEVAVAALTARDLGWMAWFSSETEKVADPQLRLIEMFTVLTGWFHAPGFHGCAFINTASEIADPTTALRQLSKWHKQKLLDYVQLLAEQAGCSHSLLLAKQLLILIDGAITVARVTGDLNTAETAKEIVRPLLAMNIPAIQK